MTAAWLVGNDVVDLRVAENVSVRERPRFLARVCDDAEQARVRAAAHPVAALWALFAAKEAAYKVVSKLRPHALLAHRRFRVAADHTTIDADGDHLALWLDVDLSAGWVHAIASTRALPVLSAIEALAADPSLVDTAAQRTGARRTVTRVVAARLEVPERELAIERPRVAGAWDGIGPPRLVRAGRPLGVDISLSPDGRFVAVATALIAT
jgi:hypothetical protein